MKANESHQPHRHGHAGHPESAPKGAAPGSSPKAPEEATLPRGAPLAETQGLLDAKTKECKELVDHLQRVAAEYSNYQKRMDRHLAEEKRQAVRDLVLDILPAVDNLDRALAHAKAPADFDALLEGVKAVHAQFLATLKKYGVTPIEAVGEAFNPEHHEAVALLPSQSHPEGAVIEEVQKGYRLDGRTIRATRVTVSGGPAKDEKPPRSSADGEAGDV